MLTLAQVAALVDGKDVNAQIDQETEVKNCINVYVGSLNTIKPHLRLPGFFSFIG